MSVTNKRTRLLRIKRQPSMMFCRARARRAYRWQVGARVAAVTSCACQELMRLLAPNYWPGGAESRCESYDQLPASERGAFL